MDALYAGLLTQKVNWVLDADIRGFFEAIDHEWLVKFVEHRIADQRVVRLIQKWLNAGVLEDGTRTWSEKGTPQGASISPLLANVYLHYVFDLWVRRWRQTQAHGDVVVVRYADDFIVGFQHRAEAERFLAELRERFAKFGLELHPEKTRLLEFGPYAAERRRRAGKGKPETFDFLGFTHICGKKRNGRFTVVRQTIRKRLQAKLSEVKAELRRRLHDPIPQVGGWLRSVVGGHIRYYGVPMNSSAMPCFATRWRGSGSALSRGAVTRGMSPGSGCAGSSTAGCPRRAFATPIPSGALASSPEVRAQCGNPARWDPWRGLWVTIISTPTLERTQKT